MKTLLLYNTLTLIYILQFCTIVNAFQIGTLRPSVTLSVVCQTISHSSQRHPLYGVIRPESVDFDFDVGQGGVRLAEESVIKITGKVTHKPGSADPTISELMRYYQLTSVDEKNVMELMNQFGIDILAAGLGTELYKDPGATTEQIILYAPVEAVRDALIGAKSAMQSSNIVINFCGGGDAQVLEVLSAIKKMVLDLDVATKAKISFNSISHSTFPLKSSAVTVIALSQPDESSDDESKVNSQNSIQQSLASGEIYFRDGKFYTLLNEDINPAIA